MSKFKELPINITEYQPLHDSVLITMNNTKEKSDLLESDKQDIYIHFIQEIVKVGKRVPAELGLEEGMQVKINVSNIVSNAPQFSEMIIYLDNNDEQMYADVPTRYLMGIVKADTSLEINVVEDEDAKEEPKEKKNVDLLNDTNE